MIAEIAGCRSEGTTIRFIGSSEFEAPVDQTEACQHRSWEYQCDPDKQTRSESHLPLLLRRSSAPVRLLTLDQARMRVDGRAVRLDTIK
jgi:hypothetical protein